MAGAGRSDAASIIVGTARLKSGVPTDIAQALDTRGDHELDGNPNAKASSTSSNLAPECIPNSVALDVPSIGESYGEIDSGSDAMTESNTGSDITSGTKAPPILDSGEDGSASRSSSPGDSAISIATSRRQQSAGTRRVRPLSPFTSEEASVEYDGSSATSSVGGPPTDFAVVANAAMQGSVLRV